jgi:polysaccharide deacetylase family protein (PEP-CTERM system associated)
MINIMTIDVEDWYQTLDLNIDSKHWHTYEDRVKSNTHIILEIFTKYNIKATFFVLGYIAKKFPELVKEINSCGHVIGSHGFMHQLVFKQSIDEFKRDITSSKILLEDIIGKPVISYRSSSWSIDERNLWALEEIELSGYLYDSSVQPFKTYLSGMKIAPKIPFSPIINNKELKIIEFPTTIYGIRRFPIPFSGGLYFRMLQFKVISSIIKNINKKKSAMIYLHPWEFDKTQPRLNVSLLVNITHYFNIKNNKEKLDKLLRNFKFTTLEEYAKTVNPEPIYLGNTNNLGESKK